MRFTAGSSALRNCEPKKSRVNETNRGVKNIELRKSAAKWAESWG
jgi:hypothetical protein